MLFPLCLAHRLPRREAYPQRKQLLTKRTKRCRMCERNLVKPEVNPSTTKFKIARFAVSAVPVITVMEVPPLTFGVEAVVPVRFANAIDNVGGLEVALGHAEPGAAAASITLPAQPTWLPPYSEVADMWDDDEESPYRTGPDNPSEILSRDSTSATLAFRIVPNEAGPIRFAVDACLRHRDDPETDEELVNFRVHFDLGTAA